MGVFVILDTEKFFAIKMKDIANYIYTDGEGQAENNNRRRLGFETKSEITIKQPDNQRCPKSVFVPFAVRKSDEQRRFGYESNNAEGHEFITLEKRLIFRSRFSIEREGCVRHLSHPSIKM